MESFTQLLPGTKAVWSQEQKIEAIENVHNWGQLGSKRISDALYNPPKNYFINDFASENEIVLKRRANIDCYQRDI